MNNLKAEQRATCAGHSPEKNGGGKSFVTCTLQGLKSPPHPTAGMRPRLACVRAGKNRVSPRTDVNQEGASRRGED